MKSPYFISACALLCMVFAATAQAQNIKYVFTPIALDNGVVMLPNENTNHVALWFAEKEAKKSSTKILVDLIDGGRRIVVRGSLMNSSVAVNAVDVKHVQDGVWIRVRTQFAWPGTRGEFLESFELTPGVNAIYFGEERALIWTRS